MDVHIDVLCRYFEVEEVRHLFSLRDETVEGGQDGLVEIGMLHVTLVDEEILMRCFLAGGLGLAYESVDTA